MTPLETAIKHVGTQAQFAAAIDKNQSYVSMLLHRIKNKGSRVPAEICPKIEEATGGKVTRQMLRPDFPWAA